MCRIHGVRKFGIAIVVECAVLRRVRVIICVVLSKVSQQPRMSALDFAISNIGAMGSEMVIALEPMDAKLIPGGVWKYRYTEL